MDGKVYISGRGDKGDYVDPLVYDCYRNQWSGLPELPHARFNLVAMPYKKQLLAIGGMAVSNGSRKASNKVFAWDEDNEMWTTPYPNMPTGRFYSCSASHESVVIVAGGVTNFDPWTVTGAVEVLHIKEHGGLLSKSYWSAVEQLPHAVYEVVPLMVDDSLYIAVGYDDDDESTCNIVTASVPELLQSSVKRTGKVWNKLPDMPYSSWSINHYRGRLVIFTGDRKVEQPGENKSTWEVIPLIHLYNPDTKSWDHVGDVPYKYLMGKSIHIGINKLLFLGGLTGTHMVGKADDMLTTCEALTLAPK